MRVKSSIQKVPYVLGLKLELKYILWLGLQFVYILWLGLQLVYVRWLATNTTGLGANLQHGENHMVGLFTPS